MDSEPGRRGRHRRGMVCFGVQVGSAWWWDWGSPELDWMTSGIVPAVEAPHFGAGTEAVEYGVLRCHHHQRNKHPGRTEIRRRCLCKAYPWISMHCWSHLELPQSPKLVHRLDDDDGRVEGETQTTRSYYATSALLHSTSYYTVYCVIDLQRLAGH
jgi:hypothetical protein